MNNLTLDDIVRYLIHHPTDGQPIDVSPFDIPTPKIKVNDISSTPYRFGSVMINGIQESIDQWDVVSTIGDGSCLLHSILYLVSPTYRKCREEIKRNITRTRNWI
jgi:hypothetical protein